MVGGSMWLVEIRDVKEDVIVVKCLWECGVVLVGKINMYEFGMGIMGINFYYGYIYVFLIIM